MVKRVCESCPTYLDLHALLQQSLALVLHLQTGPAYEQEVIFDDIDARQVNTLRKVVCWKRTKIPKVGLLIHKQTTVTPALWYADVTQLSNIPSVNAHRGCLRLPICSRTATSQNAARFLGDHFNYPPFDV